ncbi:gliding motility-associated-like protein [Flavobacterium chryseum]|uniref:HYR domain-containing protein n=1 Tax=Flavobacterium sp. P3160 TaxID=2512113 RepID=UPI00105DA817|nr:HYR domain-containing protein [Flavobacterium sp. P3160]TDO77976.1 gliding motility-associated-like protein [Flavobacterium sp. P3160]
MLNSTFIKFNSFKLISFILFSLFNINASAQFYDKHYIAPAPWQYFNKANEIVIATNSITAVSITITKSDGTAITTLSAVKGTPAVYRFDGLPSTTTPAYAFDTVISGAGLIVTGTGPISINLRNVASDALGGNNIDKEIKGNAALTSFGDAGIGVRFRVGYYRDGSLGNFNSYGDQRPIYSIMAITNGTTVTVGGVVKATLNAGQSYLFKAAIGTLVQSSNPTVMNTSAAIDTPGGCGDSAYNQVPPEAVLGSEYFIERGKGNDTAEQTTVVATKDNTTVTVNTFSVTGALTATTTTVLATAGSFFTFKNGVSNTSFSASRVSADKNVAVYSGTAQSCEVDISTIAPVSECGGSKFIETAKFRNYDTGSLPYFGYILLKDATSIVYVNGVDIETKSGVTVRHQLGTTGWYLINFEDTNIGSPNILSISSDAKLTVSIVQQGGGFSMAGFFSNFAVQPEDPTFTYISGGGCTNSTATLTSPAGFSPYQWYLNGTAISGANSNTYTATKTGAYSVASTLTCGAQTQSKPVSVTLCTDLGITKTVDNATPCVGSNVEFTVKLNNLGANNASGVSVNDLLPTGYTFVSSTPSVGAYNSTTGVWSIGNVDSGISATLKIVAKVNASGVYTNTATISSSVPDTNSANNEASVATTPNPLPTVVINNPASVCSPSKVDITAPAITAGSTTGLTFSYWTNAAATIAYSTPTVAAAGTYYIKGTTAAGCSDIKAVVVTIATPPTAGTLSGTQNICISGTTTFTSNGNSGGTWSSSDTAVATVNSSGVITGVIAGTATITYKVTGTGGCADATSTRTVTVNPTPTASITGALNACLTTTLTAVTNAASPAYVWYKNNIVINGQTGSTLVVTTDGDYKVKVTNTATTCENTSAASTVKVSDTQKPTITCPANVSKAADANSCTASGVVLGTSTTADNCGVASVTNNAPTTFPIGTTTVTWTVTDNSGNTQTCTQTVTVTDTQKPTITCPSNVTKAADANSCTASGVVLGTPTTADNCGVASVTNNAPTTFPIGTTTVTWTVTDNSGNTQTCTQAVTITDTQKPTITCPSNVTKAADANSCTASGVVLGTPTTADNCGVASVTNNAPSTFPIGTTIVTWTVTDNSGNTQTCTQTVTVTDTQKPTITCPSNITQAADANSCTASGVVLGTPTTADNCGVASVTNNAPTTFPIGITTVTWTVTDNSGNTQTCTQTVTITDTQKPTITCPSNVTQVVDANSCTASGVVLGTPTTADNCGVASVTNNAPTTFPIGTTTVIWTVTDNSGNTQTCTQAVKVVGPIKANDDIVTNFNGYSGGTAVSNVLDNDLLNCTNVIGNDITITLATALPSALNFNTTTGTVTVNPLTSAGNYTFDYTICEKLNPTNCSTASVKITVVAPIIDAITETTTSINGTTGGTTATVVANDTLNGNPVVIGTQNGQVKLTPIAVPAGLTLNADGTITVAPNTPKGNYEVEYSICEITNPTNCDTTKSIVVVGQAIIDAVSESTTSINGTTGGTTATVVVNDTLNGNPVVIGTQNGQVKLTAITVPTGLTLNADGTVTVAPNTAAGNYEVEYSICEITNPTNCDTTKSIIVVGQAVIDAVTETTTSINGNTGGTTATVVANDTLNGNPVVIGTQNGQVKLTPITVPTGLTLNADGSVTVAPNTPAGNYEVEYSICEITNPTNCDTTKSTIVVGQAVIDAVTETTTSINGTTGGTTATVVANDTLNGNPVVIGTSAGQVKLTAIIVPTGLTLNADGTITVAPNTPKGNYEVEYSICEITNPTNCDTTKSTIVVGQAVIDAVTETITSINGNTGGITVTLVANDTLNGNPVVIGTQNGQVKLTPIKVPTGLTLNADGTVTIAPNTPAGNYEVEYSICEITNPTNCDTTKSIIVVGQAVIDAVTETTTSINGTTGGTTATVVANDTLNGNPVVIGISAGQVKLTAITVPTGLTLNADGTVTIAPNTPAGNYEVEYSICEITNPTNCDAVKSTIVVGQAVIDAVTETTTSINGNTGGTTATLVANDTLNGSPVVIGTSAGQIKLTPITVPTGLTLNADGTVTVAPNTPAGNYEVEYSICEITNPTNCDTTKSTIVVGQAVIDAVTETTTSINGTTGGTTATLVANDTLNGKPVVIGTQNGQVKLTPITVPTGLTLNADGTVTIASNTPAGNYEVEYSICEITNPTNCDAVKSTIVVGQAVIDAVTETTTSINGNTGGTTATLVANDTLNGSPVVIGTSAGQIKLTPITVPTGLILNADGTVTVAPNTPKGNYEVEYSICEITNPTNCDSAKSTIVVSAGNLQANADVIPSVVATNQPQTVVNVFDNDTNNSLPVVATDLNLSIVTADPKGVLTLNPDGTVTVVANAPAGAYELTYQICEKLNPTNCSSATIKITVITPGIDAVSETTTSINGNTGDTTATLVANDTLNGNPVVIGTSAGQVKLTPITVPTGLTLNADGTVTVAPNTAAGNYEVEYSICEITNPTNCDSAKSTIVVSAGNLQANADVIPSVVATNQPQTVVNVFDNDTNNSLPVVATDLNLSIVTADPKGVLTLNPDGTVTIGANAPAGTYELTYQICEKLNPTNCSSATIKITVTAPGIDAVAETTTTLINGNVGGTTATLVANDTLNGNPVVIGTSAGQVKLTPIAVPTGLTLNADGTVTVAPNTPAGNYEVEYSICEITNPTNCDSAKSTIVVSAGNLQANADVIPSVVVTNQPQTVINVLNNDTNNSLPVVATDLNLSIVTADPKGVLTLSPDGTVTIGANAPAGTYELTYQIYEKLNPTNCSSATIKITVTAPGIDAVAETTTTLINGNVGGTTATLVANDTLNGNPVVIGTQNGQVKLTPITVPTGLTLNADGTVTVAPNTPSGNYEVEYSICEITNPTNCDSAKSTIVVSGGNLQANADVIPSVVATNQPQTVVNVFDNDTNNGLPVVSTDLNLSIVTADPKGVLTLNPDGTVTVGANAPAGTYELTYQICEKLNPTNCSSATIKITVTAPGIDAVTEITTTLINGNVGGTTATLVANDTLNGNPVVIGTSAGQVQLTPITVPTGLTLNADGTVTVAPNTPSGNYEVEYSICEITNPTNCDSAKSTIVVSGGNLQANPDTVPSVVATNQPQTVVNVFDNDTNNSLPVVSTDLNLSIVTADPKGVLTLNPDGTVTVGANAPAGTYELTYQICEKLNPTNCSSATIKVTVTAGVLQANPDTVPSVVGINQPQTVVNVFDNDTNNGLPVVATDLNLSIVTADPKEVLTLNPDGTVTVGANAPRGTYELVYQICEKLNPTNCSTATIEVTVDEATMTVTASSFCSNNVPYVTYNVVPDNFTPTTLLTIKWIDSNNNVVATETGLPLSGNILWPGAIIDNDGNGVDWPGWVLANGQWTEGADGFENTKPEVTMEFSLNTSVSIPVNYPAATPQCNARPTFAIKANDDAAGPIDATKGTSTSINVFDNDKLNGLPINPADVVLSTVIPNANLILNADGSVDVKPGTVSGDYQLTYQICDALHLSNCSQAVVNVKVLNSVIPVDPMIPIVANNDGEIAVDGINGALEFINVLDNDTLNGLPVNASDVVLTNAPTSPYFEFNSDGTVNVKPNTPGGQYTLNYQICSKANSSNCSSATLNVFVEVPAIAVIKTATFNDENASGFANAGETITYKFKITNTGNVPLKGITIIDLLPGVAVSGQAITLEVNESDENTFTAKYTIKQSDINFGSVSNQATVKGRSERGILVEDKSDDGNNLEDKPTVLPLNGCQIIVQNAISPNGDGKNERFYIQGLECYPDNTVEIYNRWGVLVFDVDHYNNDERAFTGFSAGRTTMKKSEGLPVGTYFYILKYRDSESNQHEKSGYLYINK